LNLSFRIQSRTYLPSFSAFPSPKSFEELFIEVYNYNEIARDVKCRKWSERVSDTARELSKSGLDRFLNGALDSGAFRRRMLVCLASFLEDKPLILERSRSVTFSGQVGRGSEDYAQEGGLSMGVVSGIIAGVSVLLLCLAFLLDCLHRRKIEDKRGIVRKRKPAKRKGKPVAQKSKVAPKPAKPAKKASTRMGAVKVADSVPELWDPEDAFVAP
jgi:hypothetical protein